MRKLKKHKQKHKPNQLIQKGSESGKEKLKENLRETAERSRADAPEEYGGDKLRESAEFVGYKAKETVRDGGQKIKDKASEKLRDKLSQEKPKEKDEPDRRESKEESNREYSAKDRPEPRTERRETRTKEKPEQKADSRENTIFERSERTVEPRDTRIKEKPEYNKESVKTKDNYIRSHNEPQVAEQKKDVPKTKTETPQNANNAGKTQKSASQNSGMKTVRSAPQQTTSATKTSGNVGKGTVKTAGKGTVKTAGKTTVKTAQASVKTTKAGVKTAETTAKATAKTAKTAGQVAQKAAQAAAKAAQAVAKAAATAAKVAAKAIATAVKAIVTAIKGIIAAIAAGGWIAVVIIVAICVIALIVCACCGVFASNETADGSQPMTEAIQTIDGEFRSSIDSKIADLSVGDYDAVEVKYVGDMDGDSDFAVNWNDAIAVYAVSVTMDPEAPTDVVQVTPEKVEILRRIFNEMNTVSYSTEVVETERTVINESGDEETETIRKLIISVDVSSMDAYAAAEMYSFSEDQMEALEAMMEPQMLPLYAELVGVDVYGGADLTQIISGLPAGTMGSDVLNVALTKVGAPYVLGAKGPKRFDCSGLVYWSINQIDPVLGRNLYTSAGYQYKYCKDNGYLVGESEARAGDLVFWQKPNCSCGRKYNEIHHVGFYLGDGMILDASSGNGRVIIRKKFSGSTYRVYAYARPYSY